MENKTTERWENMNEKEKIGKLIETLSIDIGKAAEKDNKVTIDMKTAVEIVVDLEMLREIQAVLNKEYMKPNPKV